MIKGGRAVGSFRGRGGALWLAGVAIGCGALGCGELSGPSQARAPLSVVSGEAAVLAGGAGALPAAPAPAAAPPPVAAVELPPPPDYEQADLVLDNDLVVAPPEPLAGCEERLRGAGISFRSARLPFVTAQSRRAGREEVVACGAEQVVTYLGGPAKIRYAHPPMLTCRLALALSRFEQLAQEQASAQLGQSIVRLEHLGTYSCRKMVRFDFVSEHSYANAIDIRALVLASGRRLTVEKDFGPLDAPARTPGAELLRSLARRAYDERLFSTVLTPYWDSLHKDHFHLDLARYRVDGTRPDPTN
jgi:hypothetical protein